MRWPIILISPRDPGSGDEVKNQKILSDLLVAQTRLRQPGSLEAFDILYTDRLKELLACTQAMQWKVTLASPSLSTAEFDYGELVKMLGPAASNILFCSQDGTEYVIEKCWKCEALCQGFITEDGCDCCADEDEPDSYVCDCSEGDGFENPAKCPVHNVSHNHALRDEWGGYLPPDSLKSLPNAQQSHIKNLMGY